MVRAARAWAIGELVAYLLLAVISTWPLARSPGGSLALGTETASTVPLFTTWTVWWNADRASQFYRGYWDAPIFHPARAAFAFSEPMTTTGVVAPVLWLSGNRLLAHNTFLLLALTLNGWAACKLLRGVRIGRWSAAWGGALIVLLPMVHHELGVLQLVPLCGILWTIHGLLLFGRRPGARRAAWLGAAFALTYLTCANYGLFLSVLLIPGAGWLWGRRLMVGRTWSALPIAALVSVVLVGPVVVQQLRVARQHGLVRSRELVGRLAARPADYLRVSRPLALEPAGIGPGRREFNLPLCPGIVVGGLALFGLCQGLARRRFRSWTAFCLSTLVLALILSLGPGFQLASWSPYGTLMDWYPGFAQVRSPFRFAMFVQVMAVLLASLGLYETGRLARNLLPAGFARRVPSRLRGRLRTAIGAGCTLALGCAALAESLPERPPIYSPPPLVTQSRWIEWLTTNTPPDCTLACLPFPTGSGVRCYEETAHWMYWATFHRRALANGYSGFLPENYLTTKQAMTHFPDHASIRRLQAQGVTCCVIRRSYLTRSDLEGDWIASHHLRWLYGDDVAQIDIYRLLDFGISACPPSCPGEDGNRHVSPRAMSRTSGDRVIGLP